MQMVEAIYLKDGYPKSRGLTGWYRDLSVREAKESRGSCHAIDWNGFVRKVILTSRQVWKTRPGCILGCKYGIRNSFSVGADNLTDDERIGSRTRIVVPVRHLFLPDTPPGIVLDWCLEKEMTDATS